MQQRCGGADVGTLTGQGRGKGDRQNFWQVQRIQLEYRQMPGTRQLPGQDRESMTGEGELFLNGGQSGAGGRQL